MKFLSYILIVLLLVVPYCAQAQFAGGSGTEEDPYQVETIEQLQAINNPDYLDKHFIQIADIDASVTAEWNDGKGFEPIGSINDPFTGGYDGSSFIISGLHINRSDEDFVGLFGFTNGEILKLGLQDVEITGKNFTGALAGVNINVIKKSYATGDVSGETEVGGLIGVIEKPSDYVVYGVSKSYANVTTSGIKSVGGLVGLHSVIIVGDNNSDPKSISQSFVIGEVSGNEFTGGLLGQGISGYSNYWDMESTLQNTGTGSDYVDYSTGLSTDQMTGPNAYIHMYRLDFENTWQLTEGYPVLQWQEPEDAVEPPDVPILLAESEFLDFGQVPEGKSDTLEVHLVNDGRAAMSVELSLDGEHPGSYSISGDAGPATLEVADTLFVDVIFSPESVDQFPAALQVNHDAPNRENPLPLELKGEGKAASSTGNPAEIPEEVKLYQNYPNPFNPTTQISYSLPHRTPVTVTVYDIMGRRVATLVDTIQDAGNHQAKFDAAGMASSLYIYRLQIPAKSITRQMMFVK